MANEMIIGFDSAWTDRVPGAICTASFFEGKLIGFEAPRLVRFHEAAAAVNKAASLSEYVLVAVDQPTLVPNSASMRPVERVAGSIVNAIGGGVQPANRGKLTMFGDEAPIWTFLDSIKARENPVAAREALTGVYLLEVFPALTLPSIIPVIWQRRRAAKYNPAGRSFSPDDWRLVTTGIAAYAMKLGMPPVVAFANELSLLPSPKKADQDKLDALICLTIALTWRHQPRETSMVIGDNTSGYMVTPINGDIRPVLVNAASQKGVPVDSTWDHDAQREFKPTDTSGITAANAEQVLGRKHISSEGNSKTVTGQNVCPECGHRFRGTGWGGIDAHWRKFHEDVMSYQLAWPIIRSGGTPSRYK